MSRFINNSLLVVCFFISHNLKANDFDIIALLDSLNKEAYHLRHENAELSVKLSDEILKTALETEHDSILAVIYSTRGTIHRALNEFDTALYFTQESLRLREKLGYPGEIAKSLNNLGSIFYDCEQYANAKKYYKKALLIRLNNNLILRIPGSFNNLGNLYQDMNQIDSSILAYETGLKYKEGDSSKLNEIRLNLGILYNKVGEWNKALLTLKSIDIELMDKTDNALRLHNLSLAYEGLKNYKSAYHYLFLAEELSDSLYNLELKMNLFKSRFILNLKSNELYEILSYFEEYDILNDSLHEYQIATKIELVEAIYNNKELNSINIQKEEELQKKEEKSEQDGNIIVVLSILICVLLILGFFVLRYFQQKRKLTHLELNSKRLEIENLMRGYELDLFEAQTSGQHSERKRISEELHDRLGGLLAAVNLQIESIENHTQNKQLTDAQNMIKEGIEEVRNVSHNLHIESLKIQSLRGSIEAICHSISQSKRFSIELYLEGLIKEYNAELEREVYKIIMELLSNSMKHSKAKRITIQINEIADELNITFEDNGIGFKPEKVKHGLGMQTINSRVNKLNGNWQIDSRPNHGSTVIINLPLK